MLSGSKIRRGRKKLTLQLTSLLDMFTIILVFLLVSFQAEDHDFVLHAGLKLPSSSAQSPFKTAVNMAITNEWVFVEGEQVYKLDQGKMKQKDIEKRSVRDITREVKKAWKARIEEKETDPEDEYVVVVQAEKSLPYSTIHTVMRSAAYAGFFKFRLVVEKQ